MLTAERHRCLVTGASGQIGRLLVPALEAAGFDVISTSRRSSQNSKVIEWNPIDPSHSHLEVSNYQAVIHLAGENISGSRWGEAFKKKLWQSRIQSTQIITRSILNSINPPDTFICASATGYYGNRGDEVLTEESGPGSGFLSDLCQAWENETAAAREAGVRVMNLRTGIVLSADAGALAKMLPAFRWGLGAKLGNGMQWMSWIHIEDMIQLILFSLTNKSLAGPLNCCAPYPVRNAEFTKILASNLNRLQAPSAPAWVLKLVLGEMADALLLSSTRAIPQKASRAGFHFKNPDIESSFLKLLTKSA